MTLSELLVELHKIEDKSMKVVRADGEWFEVDVNIITIEVDVDGNKYVCIGN